MKAEAGIGTLIIFIATIFVSALAASVLIQTSQSLQSQALKTANGARNSISSHLDMTSIIASDGRNGTIEQFRIHARPSASSQSVDLRDSLITLEYSNATLNLIYSGESCTNVTDASGDGYYLDRTNKNGTFTIEYIKTTDGHQKGILKRGEIAKICFGSIYSIGSDKSITIRITPENGLPTTKEIFMPSVIVNQNIRLFP